MEPKGNKRTRTKDHVFAGAAPPVAAFIAGASDRGGEGDPSGSAGVKELVAKYGEGVTEVLADGDGMEANEVMASSSLQEAAFPRSSGGEHAGDSTWDLIKETGEKIDKNQEKLEANQAALAELFGRKSKYETSSATPEPALPSPVPAVSSSEGVRRRRAGPAPLPPQGAVVKGDLGDMFRNSHFGQHQEELGRRTGSSVYSGALSQPDEVIVLDSDEEEDEEEEEEGDTSEVEKVGLGLLELVEGASSQPNPATNNTVIKSLDMQRRRGEEEVVEKGVEEDMEEEVEADGTIVLDDTLEEGESEVELVGEVAGVAAPLVGATMQEVTRRYAATTEDFIPFQSPRQRKAARQEANRQSRGRGVAVEVRGRGRGRGGMREHRGRGGWQGGSERWLGLQNLNQHPPPSLPTFRPEPTASLDLNFGGRGRGRGEGVFRFGGVVGKRAGKVGELQVAKDTMFVGGEAREERQGLRPIVIDGSNVAMSHGGNKFFSARGIAMVAEHFARLGHRVVAFVPQFRSKAGQVRDPQVGLRCRCRCSSLPRCWRSWRRRGRWCSRPPGRPTPSASPPTTTHLCSTTPPSTAAWW